jgi:hypothetical protein
MRTRRPDGDPHRRQPTVTRRLALYLRSRSAPATLATMLGGAVGLWALGHTVDDPYRRSQLALLATVLAIAAVAPGLAGADIDLDRLAGFAWPPRRAAHLIIAGAVAVALLAATTGDVTATSTARIARDAAGMTGLIGLGAATLSASRAPLPSLLWTALVVGIPPTSRPTHRVILTWMMQPTDTTAATLTAMTLAATGILAYAIAGPRR